MSTTYGHRVVAEDSAEIGGINEIDHQAKGIIRLEGSKLNPERVVVRIGEVAVSVESRQLLAGLLTVSKPRLIPDTTNFEVKKTQ